MTNGPTSRASTSSNTNAAGSSFEIFFNGWLQGQQRYLEELLSAQQRSHESPDEDLKELVARVLAHYQQYFEEKSRAAQRDIFHVFSPTWFSSFEYSMLWIAGFKPALAFKLISESVHDLSQEQRERLKRLNKETRVEEKMLNDELARIQETVAAPPLVGIARQHARQANAEVSEEGTALTTLKKSLLELVLNADMLRMTTAVKVVEILNPAQNVRFLAAAAQLMMGVRNRGMQMDGKKKVGTNMPSPVG